MEQYLSTAYDDVFRTLLNDCSRLIIPVINEVFGEKYTGDEKIEFAPNEHFLNSQDGDEQKRITDSNFRVIAKSTRKRYHFECESTPDLRILIRMFEYDMQIGLDQDSEINENELIVNLPNSAVLFLRSKPSTPDQMRVIIRTPGGEVSYEIPAMKVKNYSIDDIFGKRLLFLIPFYIFTYEARFDEIEGDRRKLEELMKEYEDIKNRLEKLTADGQLDEYTKKTLMDMSERVLKQIAKNYENIQEGVGSIMGGKVLDYEAKRIKNEGREEERREWQQKDREWEQERQRMQQEIERLQMKLREADGTSGWAT